VLRTRRPRKPHCMEVSVNLVAEFNLCNGHANFGGFVIKTGTPSCIDRSAC
jgi:hypothetical protein